MLNVPLYYEVDRKNIFKSYLGRIFIQEKLQKIATEGEKIKQLFQGDRR